MPIVVRKLLLFQSLITLIAAVLAFAIDGWFSSRAALAGGLIVIGATVFSARRAFSAGPGSSPEQILAALVRAEAFKFVFIAVSVFAAVMLMEGGHLAMFGTLFATLLANHAALLFMAQSKSTP